MRRVFAVLLLICLPVIPLPAAKEKDTKKLEIHGLMFGDYYWVPLNHRPALEGENGFWFRRIYLTFDSKLGEPFSARLRFEAQSPGDFVDDARLEGFVKDAWLKWKLTDHEILFGISPTPTIDFVEKMWGYRPLQKSPLDLQQIRPTRDFGVAAHGKLNGSGTIRYRAMAGNGSGVGAEVDEGKSVSAAFNFHPTKPLYVDVYADHAQREGELDSSTFQIFAACNKERYRVGVLYARQNREIGVGSADLDLDVASIYGVLEIKDDLTFVSRIDRMFDPNPQGPLILYIPFSPIAKSTLLILGTDFKLHEKVNFIPNVQAIFYDDAILGLPDPDNDLQVRLTLFFHY